MHSLIHKRNFCTQSMISWWLDTSDMLWIQTANSKNLRVGKEPPDELMQMPIWLKDRSMRGSGHLENKLRKVTRSVGNYLSAALWNGSARALTTPIFCGLKTAVPNLAVLLAHCMSPRTFLDPTVHIYNMGLNVRILPLLLVNESVKSKQTSLWAICWIMLLARTSHLLLNVNLGEAPDENTSKKANLTDCERQPSL